jgi:hypothetical protein
MDWHGIVECRSSSSKTSMATINPWSPCVDRILRLVSAKMPVDPEPHPRQYFEERPDAVAIEDRRGMRSN